MSGYCHNSANGDTNHWASLIAQLVKNLPATQEIWVRKICWRRDRLPTPVFLDFPCGSAGKESACNAGDPSSILGSGRSAGKGIGYPSPEFLGFPCGSAGKESTCNAGDPGLIPGSGRSLGEGIGYPLQYSWASLVAQMLKNVPAMQETLVQFLGWEYPLEKG